MPLRFSLRQLEYLVAVGECGSIALASEKVGSLMADSSSVSSVAMDPLGGHAGPGGQRWYQPRHETDPVFVDGNCRTRVQCMR